MFFFFYETTKFSRKSCQNERFVQFSYIKSEKVACLESHCLKFGSDYICRKNEKNVIRRIFSSIVIPANFIHFRQRIGFKSALGNFSLLSGLMRTALTCLKQFKF